MLTLLIIGNESFRNGLSNSIDLRNMTTAAHSHSDINAGELFLEHKRKHRRFMKIPILIALVTAHGEIAFRIYS